MAGTREAKRIPEPLRSGRRSLFHQGSRVALLALLLGVCGPAIADDKPGSTCPTSVEAALRQALASETITKTASRGELRELDCAPVGGPEGGEIVAIANFVDTSAEQVDYTSETYTVILAALDPEGRAVHRQKVVTTGSDATTEFSGGNFELEMELHDVAPGGRAVGVSARSSAIGASAPDNRWGDEFALFVPEGKGFRRVLGLARFRQEAIEGCVSVQCQGSRWIETTSTLTPGGRDANGWRQIAMRLDAEEFAVEPAVAQSAPTSTTLPLVHREGAYRQEDGSPPPGSEYFYLVPW